VELLGVEQENVSRIERRADFLLSTLANYVAAMGGKLRLIAEFPNRKPVAVALGDLSESAPGKPRRRSRDTKTKPAEYTSLPMRSFDSASTALLSGLLIETC
jgi:hypothetical protein